MFFGVLLFFFCKQKTAYELRISDWSSDVCSSDLLLLAADILFGEVKGPNDLLEDPHLEAMGMFPVVDHPSEGKIRLLGFPISFSETPCRLRRLPPRLGEHGPEVLRALGFDADAIAAMGYQPQP